MFSASLSDTCFSRSISSNALKLLSSKKYSDAGPVYLISLNLKKMSENEHFRGLALSDTEVTSFKWQWHLKA